MKSQHLLNLLENYPILKDIESDIQNAYETIINAYSNNKKLLLCGNGGSCSDADHIVGELLKSFKLRRKANKPEFISKIKEKFNNYQEIIDNLEDGLPAISLSSHPGFQTAFANDVNGDYAFAQQLYVLGNEDDVLIGLSTSGNSKNVYKAFQVAYGKGIKTILLTGAGGGKCSELADVIIKVPSTETFRIQEYHLPIYHALCLMIEEYFYGK